MIMEKDIRVLTKEEVLDIAYMLEGKVWDLLPDAIIRVIGSNFTYIADESIDDIKKELVKAFK